MRESEPLLSGQQKASYTQLAVDQEGEALLLSDEQDSQNRQQDVILAEIETIKANIPLYSLIISIASLLTCVFVVAVDQTLFVTLISDVGSAFSSSDLAFWIGTAYMLTMCVVAPIYGRLNDVFGRKNALICAVGLFLIGTGLCVIAPSMETLILARGLAGLGGGGIGTCYGVILGDLVPLRKRPIYQAYNQLFYSLGTSCGGPLGGLLNDRLGWRMAIAAQLPILLLSLLSITLFLQIPTFPKSEEEQRQKAQDSAKSTLQLIRKRLDLTGCFLLFTTCLALMLGLSFSSSQNLPFSNIKVWATLVTSAILFIILIWFEAYIAKEPILPLHLLKGTTTALVVTWYLFEFWAIAAYFYFPVFFRSVLLQTASQAGNHMISMTVATALGSISSGLLLSKTNRYKWFINICSFVVIITYAHLSTWSNTRPPSSFWQNFVLVPWGYGGSAVNSIAIVLTLASNSREAQAAIMGLLYLVRSLSNIIGISTYGTLIQAILTRQLTEHIRGPNAAEVIEKIRKNANIVATLPDELKIVAFQAYSKALSAVHICSTVFVFICAIVALFFKEIPLDQKKTSNTSSTNYSASSEAVDGQLEASRA